jgi:hypothetical protein
VCDEQHYKAKSDDLELHLYNLLECGANANRAITAAYIVICKTVARMRKLRPGIEE